MLGTSISMDLVIQYGLQAASGLLFWMSFGQIGWPVYPQDLSEI